MSKLKTIGAIDKHFCQILIKPDKQVSSQHVQVAYNPHVLLPASKLGENSEVLVQDIAKLAEPYEEVTYWQLQV